MSFDPTEDEWIDALVDLLSEAGYPKAGRSEIVRVGMRALQDALAGRTHSEILTFFVLGDAEWLLASFNRTPRLPFDWALPQPCVRAPSDSPRRCLPWSVVPDSCALGWSVRLASVPSVLARDPLMPWSFARADTLHITITPNDTGNPLGKLADVDVHVRGDSLVEGLTLIGFSIWERRGGSSRHVIFPARQDAVNGARRRVPLLPPIVDTAAPRALRDALLDGYAEFEPSATAEASRARHWRGRERPISLDKLRKRYTGM